MCDCVGDNQGRQTGRTFRGEKYFHPLGHLKLEWIDGGQLATLIYSKRKRLDQDMNIGK